MQEPSEAFDRLHATHRCEEDSLPCVYAGSNLQTEIIEKGTVFVGLDAVPKVNGRLLTIFTLKGILIIEERMSIGEYYYVLTFSFGVPLSNALFGINQMSGGTWMGDLVGRTECFLTDKALTWIEQNLPQLVEFCCGDPIEEPELREHSIDFFKSLLMRLDVLHKDTLDTLRY